MNKKYTLTIKKRTQTQWLVWVLIVMPFLLGLLNDFLGLPWSVRYLQDFVWLVLLVLMLCHQRQLDLRKVKGLLVWCILFTLYTVLVYLVEFQSPLYYLWGLRNNFRFYVAFFAFVLFLTQSESESFFRLFDRLLWVNLVVSLFQFFVLEIKGDYLGGIFGTESGANAYTNIFLAIVVARSLLLYIQKREKLSVCIAKCVAALAMAALAEIKFFFAEFIIILVLAILFTDFTWRKLLIIIGGFSIVSLGAVVLISIFPNSAGFLSVEYFWDIATSNRGYTSSGDINRLTAIPLINEHWLHTWGKRIFGFGLGNCETSGFSFLNTPFFEKYGDMHYSWFSYAMMYLECGWIGLIFYFGFFALVYLKVLKIEKHCDPKNKVYCHIARIMAILCMLISIYNSSLRTEAGYMAYFVLAVPFVLSTKGKRE